MKHAAARGPYHPAYPISAGLARPSLHEMVSSESLGRGQIPENMRGGVWEGKRMREGASAFNAPVQEKNAEATERSRPSSPAIGVAKEGGTISPDRSSDLAKPIKKKDPVCAGKAEMTTKKRKKKNSSSWGRVPREVSAAIQEELLNLVEDFEAEIPPPSVLREVANRSGCLVSALAEVMACNSTDTIFKQTAALDGMTDSRYDLVHVL